MNEIQPRKGETFDQFHRRATERMERGPAFLYQAKQWKCPRCGRPYCDSNCL